ncbi:quinolinate synthase [candidate division TA06 bacterium B3_TA06]|uniref:Quinolinate synthase n=1 Tax=candidate division TA06 bacterium B3_TA06 TaxID=2012487 RepID=A0A532V5Z8_UNCT6|nr:MAG: quinolinate synthase [candidate division TA06 bacterium B3_TA06]
MADAVATKELSTEEMTLEIRQLARERQALILVHNYQLPEIQDLADYLGDSLDLARRSAEATHPVILFCGVRFMAETAKILAPDKMVLLPRPDAGCPMADMADVEGLRNLKAEHPNAKVVAYVNTNADIKAEVDVCCTSANAVKVVEGVDAEEIIFVPDCNLASYVQRFTKKKIIPWAGFCPIHRRFTVEEVKAVRERYPDALIMVHPECDPEVIDLIDEVTSTNGMVRLAQSSDRKRFIVGTEEGLIYRLKKENPAKEFYSLGAPKVCENMKKIRLKHVLEALKKDQYQIQVDPSIAFRAQKALDEMLRYV